MVGTAEADMVWVDKEDMGIAPVGKGADRAEVGKAPDAADRRESRIHTNGKVWYR